MLFILIFAYLSVIAGDLGHPTMETVGLTISFALGVFIFVGWLVSLAGEADDDSG